jgi:hypothetical protein
MNLEDVSSNKENAGFLQMYLRALDDLQIEAEDNNYQTIELKARLNAINDLHGSTFKFSIKDTENHYLTRATLSLDTVRSYTLKQILDYKNTGVSGSIVPRIFTLGVNILFGEAKKGKSRLIYFLLQSLIVTKEFLGLPTRRVGTILYYQLEEPTFLIKDRLINNQLDDIENEDVLKAVENDQIVIIKELDISGGITQVKRDVKNFGIKHKVDLIIIDSLRLAMVNSSLSETSADWAKPVAQLQSYSNLKNISVIILDHTNAAGAPSGTTAKKGHANQILLLKSPEDPTKYSEDALLLETKPREGTASKFIIQPFRDGSIETLELIKEEGVTAEVLSLQIKILNLLKKDDYKEGVVELGLAIERIAELLNVTSMSDLRFALNRLRESSFVASNRKSRVDYYYIPNYILDLYGLTGILGKAEELDLRFQDISVQVQSATTKQEVQQAFKGMTVRDKEVVFRLLPVEEQERLRSLT